MISKDRITTVAIIALISLGVAGAIECAVLIPTGEAQEFAGSSVIYADVVESKEQDGPAMLELRPLVTLTGPLDAASEPNVKVGLLVGLDVNEVVRLPAKGTKVIVLLKHDRYSPAYSIPNGGVWFFPEIDHPSAVSARKVQPALFEVTGFEDPKVTETIENLRKLRTKHREEAEKKAAAEKK